MDDPTTAKSYSIRCPFCEVYELEPCGRASMRCPSCASFFGGALLKTLHQITELPAAIGRHACECGHPEMRRLPDEVYAKLVEAYVDDVARHYLLSKLTLRIGEHPKELNGYLGYSSNGTKTRGDSTIDIALRDLSLRQDSDRPVYRLLVAPCRQEICTYNGCAGYRYARTHPRVAVGDGETPMPKGGAS
jgi:hypothetical protein